MDMAFYKKIYAIVSAKLRNVKKFNKYIIHFDGNAFESEEEISRLIATVPDDIQLGFIRYLQNIAFGMMFGIGWDRAVAMDWDPKNGSGASYILAGEFLNCCRNGEVLGDATMCRINKDVHNRIYTLLINGCFD